MSAYRVAQRYARSLIELPANREELQRIVKDKEQMRKALENRDFYLLLRSPIINAGKKKSVIRHIFGDGLSRLSMAFLLRLIDKGREEHLPAILDAFDEQYRAKMGISVAKLKTARPLSENAIDRIRKALEESGMTRKTVQIEQTVDENLIGGFIIELDDKLYDTSVKSKLENLRRQFSTH